MSTEFDQLLDETLAEFRQKRAEIAEMQKEMNGVTGTATAPRKVVTVTVGRFGEVTEIKFPTGAYKRMAPAELASVIQSTVDEARANALKQTAELMRKVLPPELDADALVSGTADITALLPEEPRFMPSLITSIKDDRIRP